MKIKKKVIRIIGTSSSPFENSFYVNEKNINRDTIRGVSWEIGGCPYGTSYLGFDSLEDISKVIKASGCEIESVTELKCDLYNHWCYDSSRTGLCSDRCCALCDFKDCPEVRCSRVPEVY